MVKALQVHVAQCCTLDVTIQVTDTNNYPTVLAVNGNQVSGTDFLVNFPKQPKFRSAYIISEYFN